MPVSRLRGALVHGFGTFSERPLIVDSTRLSIVGEGEWAAVKHGGRDRRGWRKLHLGVDQSGMVVAQAITAATVDDGTTGITLIEAADGNLRSVTADALRYRRCAWRDRCGPAGEHGQPVSTRTEVECA